MVILNIHKTFWFPTIFSKIIPGQFVQEVGRDNP